jgi:hypothetical protein
MRTCYALAALLGDEAAAQGGETGLETATVAPLARRRTLLILVLHLRGL